MKFPASRRGRTRIRPVAGLARFLPGGIPREAVHRVPRFRLVQLLLHRHVLLADHHQGRRHVPQADTTDVENRPHIASESLRGVPSTPCYRGRPERRQSAEAFHAERSEGADRQRSVPVLATATATAAAATAESTLLSELSVPEIGADRKNERAKQTRAVSISKERQTT